MGYNIQSQGSDAQVKVNGGNPDGTTGQPQTDFIITQPGSPNEHLHVVMDVNGNEVYNQWRPNH